jgi:prophage regulatory protein
MHLICSCRVYTGNVACCLLFNIMNGESVTTRRPQVLRLRDLRQEYGSAPATVWKLIKLGLWPPPISLTGKSRAWVVVECDRVLAARIRGENDEAIKKLVRELVVARKTAGIEAA